MFIFFIFWFDLLRVLIKHVLRRQVPLNGIRIDYFDLLPLCTQQLPRSTTPGAGAGHRDISHHHSPPTAHRCVLSAVHGEVSGPTLHTVSDVAD